MNDFRSMHDYYHRGETLSFQSRCQALEKLQKLIDQNSDAIVENLGLDLGRHPVESYTAEVATTLSEINFALKNLKRWMDPHRTPTRWYHFPARSYYLSRPKGLVAILGPWNYPFHLLISPLVGALAAGNCVVLKPSEVAPHTAQLIHDLVPRYFDSDHVRVVCGDAQSAAQLSNYKFDHIFFTGSGNIGQKVLTAAAAKMVPVTLELGGKSPAIVLEDAYLPLVAKRICWGKFLNAGQTCVAPDYLLVSHHLFPQLLEALKKTICLFYGEDPFVSKDYSRIINESHFQRLLSLMKYGQIYAGGRNNPLELRIEPTVLINPQLSSPLMQEEIFGPLLPVVSFSQEQEAIDFVNSRPTPLAAYIFGEDKKRIHEFCQKIAAGGLAINDTISHIIGPHLPFGGIGPSGMGKYHGKFSFDCFSHDQAVFWRSSRLELPLRYPPYKTGLKFLKKYFRI